MNPAHTPNLISGLRLVLVPPVVGCILLQAPVPALALFVIAGFSDALDGYLAKRFDWQSQLGGFLDGIADKLLLVGAMLALAWIGQLPVWLVAAAVCRDLIIMAGAIAFRLFVGRFTPEPSVLSKLNTLLQILVVMVGLTAWLGVDYAGWMEVGVYGASLALAIASGLGYVIVWGRRAAAGVTY